MNNPFFNVLPGTTEKLKSTSSFGEAGHLWRIEEIHALTLALAAGRPLLVRGEAGSGKSQLARAAACALSGSEEHLFSEIVHARFEAMDLLYRFDAVARLADASANMISKERDAYVYHGAMWNAMDTCSQGHHAVLLIDEIDKADADLPNALLGVLGNRSFCVREAKPQLTVGSERMPLVIITTNEERELPPAFVRRCVVLNQNPPSHDESDSGFLAWLAERGAAHQHLQVESGTAAHAARQVLADRKQAIQDGYPKVGLAEYIDLLTALHALTNHVPAPQRERKQDEWLAQLSAYALVKGADQNQARASLLPDATEIQGS